MKENKKAEERAENRNKAIAPVLLALGEGAGSAETARPRRGIRAQNQNSAIGGHKAEPVAGAGLA